MSIHQALAKDYASGGYEITGENSAHFPKQGITVQGEYFDRVNGGEWQRTSNLVTNEGITFILNAALGTQSKPGSFYLALFSGSAQPQSTWTAANFSSLSKEITSEEEGYEGQNRPIWSSRNTDNNVISNVNSVARITMKTAGQLTVTGVALLTHPFKGSNEGFLISATKYSQPRVFQNGDIYEIGYNITLTV